MDLANLSLDGASAQATDAIRQSLSARLDAAAMAAGRAEVDQVSKELESVFATMLVKEMRRGMATGFFGEGAAGDVYGGWFDEHIGRALGESGALDLAGMVKASIGDKAAQKPAEDAR